MTRYIVQRRIKMIEDTTYLFIEVLDKSKFAFIPASYDKEHNTYIPPMIIPMIIDYGKTWAFTKEELLWLEREN